ncbi:Zn-dependent alcohol dehydrogenase [Hyaloraphidium curvatum]|nr:Zn-dependent alcohol dehydrogenase [Hyaloraphidium curvatum]
MTLPTTMRAAVLNGSRPLELTTLPVPSPGPGELLMKVAAAGICHTDQIMEGLHKALGTGPGLPLGHEGAGVVVAVGEGVQGFAVGDRILSPAHSDWCGSCPDCKRGDDRLCAKRSFHAGQMAIQIAKAKGVKVVALDVDETKLSAAKELGADGTVNPAKAGADLAAQVAAVLGGHAPDASIVYTGAVPAFASATTIVRPGGAAVFVGVPDGPVTLDVMALELANVRILTQLAGSSEQAAEVMKMIAEGKVKPRVTPCKLEDINGVFEEMDRGAVRDRYVVQLEAK